MSPRELAILILGLAIIAVILRGLFVALQGRRGQLRLAIDKNIPRDVDLDALELAELPSGGARVVARSFAEVNRQNHVVAAASARAAHIDLGERKARTAPIPVLMDPVQLNSAKAGPGPAQTASAVATACSTTTDATTSATTNQPEFKDDADSVLLDYGTRSAVADNLSQVAPDYPDDELDEDDFEDDYDDFENDPDEEDDSEFEDDDLNSVEDEDDDLDEDDFTDDEDDDSEFADDDDFDDDEYDPLDEEEDLIDSDIEEDLGYVDDDLDEFSMTAGERIGFGPTGNRPAQQTNLFSDDEITPPKAEKPARRKNLFAAFGRKLRQSEPSGEGSQAVAARAAPVVSVAPGPAIVSKPQLTEKPPVIVAKPKPARIAPVQESQKNKEVVAEPAFDKAAAEPSEVVVLNVMAKSGRLFAGDDLLHVLITSGMKFGDMNIFHRRLGGDSKGPVIFSIANILNPGTFDLNRMHDFTTLGISLFLALPTSIKNLDAFDQMLGVAQQICGALDGDLRDDNRNLMTAQTIEHYRQRIRDFELRRLKAVGTRG